MVELIGDVGVVNVVIEVGKVVIEDLGCLVLSYVIVRMSEDIKVFFVF